MIVGSSPASPAKQQERERQTLQDTLLKYRWVCRIQTDNGATIIKLFWVNVLKETDPNLAPFVYSMPIRLMKDLQANGFDGIGQSEIYDPVKDGIFSAFLRSERKRSLEIARQLVLDYSMERGDNVEWADQ